MMYYMFSDISSGMLISSMMVLICKELFLMLIYVISRLSMKVSGVVMRMLLI